LFYPNGNRPDPDQSSDFVSVFVFLDAACIAVKAVIGFDVLDHTTGEPVARFGRSDGGEVRNFPCVGAFWGYEDFVQRQEVENFLLKDDCFSVRCNITVIEFGTAARPQQRSAVPPPALPRDFRELLQSGQGADVRFRVSGVTFAAHRCVLAARSPVFKAQLYGVMKESSAQHNTALYCRSRG
jgi:speckle-type POZ protein